MSNIIPFEFKGETFRLIDQDGGAWLAGTQVAKAMGYTNPNEAVRTHCKHARIFNHSELLCLNFPDPPSRGLLMIPEGDVMRLIARSNLPAAQEFECKVFDEILPQIRKTGTYGSPNVRDPGYATAVLIEALKYQKELEGENATLREAHVADTKLLEEIKPKAEQYDRIAETAGLFTINQVAKILHIPDKIFRRKLVAEKYTYPDRGGWNFYAIRRSLDIFELRTHPWKDKEGVEHEKPWVLITPRGLQYFAERWAPELPLPKVAKRNPRHDGSTVQ